MKTTMKSLMLGSVLAFALPLSAFATGGGNPPPAGGNTTVIGVDSSSDSSSGAAAGASARNGNQSMVNNNNAAVASAIGTGSGDCGKGAGIQLLEFGFALTNVNGDCVLMYTLPANHAGGYIPDNIALALYLGASNANIDTYLADGSHVVAKRGKVTIMPKSMVAAPASISTAGQASAKPAMTSKAININININGKRFNLSGDNLAIWQSGKTMSFQMDDGSLVKANINMM